MGDRRLCFVSTLLRSVLSRHSFGLRVLSSPDISSHRENKESLLETSGSYIVPRQDINFAGRKQVQFWIQPRLDFMGTVSAEALVDQVLEKTPRPSTFNGDGNALVKTQGESAKENTELLIEKNMQEDYDAQNVPRPTSFNEEENTLVKKQKENVEENTEFSAEKEIQVDYKSHNVVSTNHQVLDSTAELSMEKKMHENYNIENAVASLSLQTENGHTCEEKKLHVVFVLGGPGSGKGTQCAKIVETFGFTHLSAGDLLRAEIKSGSENGTMIQNMIKEGKIVPSEVTVKLLQKAMQENENDKFLIDGFPRNEENRAAFENVTGIEPEFILFFDCPEEEMERRLLNRNQGRVDDNIETIRKRFKVFVESSLPVVGYYDLKGKVHKIDAARTKEDIFECIKELFSPYIQETRIVKTKDD